jgi:transcriptional regulator with XRE-family HTH domain
MATELALGTRIKRARERRRWTQQQLADALRVDRKTVDNWENGRAYPRSSLGAIEDVLGVRPGDEDEGRARPVSPQTRREIAELLDDEEDRRYVIGLLEGTITRPNGPQGQAPGRTAEDGTPAARQTGA